MSDLVLSYIRTYVPIGIGALLSYIAVRWGIGVPEDVSKEVAVAVTALVVALYYGIVRALEKKWPWFGTLLGAKKEPVYVEPPK
jgi:hypothetical protein